MDSLRPGRSFAPTYYSPSVYSSRSVTPLKRASDAAWPFPTLTANPAIHDPVAPAFSGAVRSLTPPPPIAAPPWTPRLPSYVAPTDGIPFDYARRAYSYSSDVPRLGRPLDASPISAPVRSVTPPPIQNPIEDGWVTVSTMNMSPFMILRIKALIELAAIQSYPKHEKFAVQLSAAAAEKPPAKRNCLTRQKSPEMAQLEAMNLAEDEDARRVTLLNTLLTQSRQVRRRAFNDILKEVNENFDREKTSLIPQCEDDLSTCGSSRKTKLTFSSGASLICFDSSEKPKKIRDNHAKHFHNFISQQQRALMPHMSPPASAMVAPAKMVSPTPPTPSTATPPISPAMPPLLKSLSLPDQKSYHEAGFQHASRASLDWPIGRIPNKRSPSSGSVQTAMETWS